MTLKSLSYAEKVEVLRLQLALAKTERERRAFKKELNALIACTKVTRRA